MIGKSPAFLNLLNLIQKISNSDVPVFIEGENGAGLESAARAIHLRSPRKTAPFEMLNCSTTPEAEIEEELAALSHGMQDDDKADDAGMSEASQGGTLFLDDVDALKPKAQAALLRFLQEQQRRTLGGGGVSVRDVRIIAASNRDISSLTASGAFRQDLFYRLSLMKLKTPPLRERKGDVELLADHFLRACGIRYGSEKQLDESTREWLDKYDWPGNIRELETMISREYLVSDGNVIHIPSRLANTEERRKQNDRRNVNITSLSFNKAKSKAIREFECRYLDAILTTTEGNVTRAANMVGKERRSLGKLLKKHGIDRQQYSRKSARIAVKEERVFNDAGMMPAWGAMAGSQAAQPLSLLPK